MSKGNVGRRKELGLLGRGVKCTARRTNGKPCGRFAIQGGSVCATHGGSAPQVRAKAKRRLDAFADQAVQGLLNLAQYADSEAVRLAALRDALDRIGVTAKIDIELTLQPWQQLIDGIVGEVEDDQVSRVTRLLSGDDTETDDPAIIDAEIVDSGEGELPDLIRSSPTTAQQPATQPRIPSRRKRGSR